jgi:histidinol-phosphate aminotransferase
MHTEIQAKTHDIVHTSEPPVHGAFDYAELASLGLRPQDIIDFSVNGNPYGPSPRARQTLAHVDIERYPDRACLKLKQAIFDYELSTPDLTPDSLVCGNGTTELIWATARAYLRPGLKAAIIGPTFGEYCAACLAVGATVNEYYAPAPHFQPDIAEITAWLTGERPALVWLCNPNNPTGSWLDQASLLALAETCRALGASLVVDEAYWHFVAPQETFFAPALIGTMPGLELLVLRSLTKDFALAGLRLGYIVTSYPIAQRLRAHLPSWNVNSAAQDVGVAALADRAYFASTLNTLQHERATFFQALKQHSLNPVPSCTHFCLIPVHNARDVRQRLLTRNIQVRDCTSFGLPRHIRVSTRPEWPQLLTALKEVV